MACRVFALAAHADDIEFGMAGTLVLLRRAGCEIHYMNLADGSCGSDERDARSIAAIRLEEARRAAARLGAEFHPPLVPDIEVFYEKGLLARVASVMRRVAPDVLLVHSPWDYMEDHVNACRLAVTAAFCRGMPNFPVDPPRPPVAGPVTVYHAQPHGHRDAVNRPVAPEFFVDIDSAIDEKAALLAEHRSQQQWLDRTQGFSAYVNTMRQFAREMGTLSGRCEYAEGWRRHNPLGFCAADADPLADILADFVVKP
ncbi:MAG TPA: PIG-L family deacetylase [Thermoguttaceae bacterium]|nr:PIG-L family deacetylase [Thermoguttaceae bacterium]